ncbi:hypothetical protein AVEN_161475-1 [Araneus ventricosus]|uniref:Uncharacterized protein n=1 Tax=Araneus ventricosus TaxID=182803 RepID=A0A4Y2BUI0_ARAVE|nr:hypothetical protein AVEN_95908-1 [Araneus ventricosus]GBL95836.1 hypothetical protein AVEN_246512-1 [Araneus ventricosus]GBL95887.1 hypothetical protein AVEN_69307-1 [Araneus ventricosus]GBL95921.1 hypothetical protein AVEN_161475-1 [Araneus ventricosus]
MLVLRNNHSTQRSKFAKMLVLRNNHSTRRSKYKRPTIFLFKNRKHLRMPTPHGYLWSASIVNAYFSPINAQQIANIRCSETAPPSDRMGHAPPNTRPCD